MNEAPLTWNDKYRLNIARMDATHQEFVDLLAAVHHADDDELISRWQALVEHTQLHFETEDNWMRATQFAASNCHTTHHKQVLDVMREGLKYGMQGHKKIIRQMADELATWFPLHADTMDAALAIHLQRVGFDPDTGHIAHPQALPTELIHGCAGEHCSEPALEENNTAPSAEPEHA